MPAGLIDDHLVVVGHLRRSRSTSAVVAVKVSLARSRSLVIV